MTNKNIDIDDLDDLIGIAERLREEDTDKMSFEEMAAIAKELNISPEYLQKAIKELEKKRQQEEEDKQKSIQEQKASAKTLKYTSFAIGGVLFLSCLFSYASLSGKDADVELQRSMVGNALERQKVVQKRYGKESPTPEVNASIDGAENRVRIAKQRYDKAATVYNATARSFLHRPWAGLLGFPSKQPLSTARTSW